MDRETLRVCDFCFRSELEIFPIRLTGDDEGLQVCIKCEPKYNQPIEHKLYHIGGEKMVKINEYKPYRGFIDLRDYKLTIKTFKQLWRIQETLSEMEKKKKYYKKWHPTQWERAKDLSANYQAIIMNAPVKRRLK